MEMDEIIFTLKEIVRELNPDVLWVPKYGGELSEHIPNNEKSRVDHDVSAAGVIEEDVAHRDLPAAVKVDAHEVPGGVQCR